ncbi:hypothetical protein N658DRAFT_473420 [Parathielavia hyrcaniae]|uniref:RNA polymerase II subunit B1 CTD phosphatase RPAP2 homolog n=1 Tax=Parathielavia hyrcaniae TaxID=113614 RepID=A0AAN6T0G4_9PEZI|nr:hypothetical protein N658DRAFT_473420 [Parathielavia hyrcaniae]
MGSETTPPPRPSPKGILKKPSAPSITEQQQPPSPPPLESSSSTPLTRTELLGQQETAARIRLLQKLRETELKPPVPLETFELLSQLPRSPPDTSNPASNPSPADATLFLALLRDFQPREYLDLIEERNCLGKCGYALCPRPRRAHAGGFKIMARSSSSGSSIARTADLNKWCSDACAARALYLKVQLDNPTYERITSTTTGDGGGGGGRLVVKLVLREEKGDASRKNGTAAAAAAAAVPRGSQEDRDQLARAMAQLEIDKHKQAKRDASALAGERGDPGGSLAGLSRLDVTIKESEPDGPAEPPSNLPEGAAYMVEGYKPRSTKAEGSKQLEEGAETDDEDDDFFTVRF